MYLAYFDENKYSKENPYFFIGGLLIPEEKIQELEIALIQLQSNFFDSATLSLHTEFHGKEMFHGKGHFKGRPLNERIQLFENIGELIINYQLPIRMVCIDVNAHRKRCAIPEPEYKLGLMLILERFCDYLEQMNSIGIVFGDYEKDEVTSAVTNFSEFKRTGTTKYSGRNLQRLIDTVYFTHSHHSRFLQVADVLVYIAGRFENMVESPSKWHEKKIFDLWQNIKANTDTKVQCWP